MTIELLGDHVSIPTLFAQISERNGLEAVVAVVKANGCWYSTWSTEVDLGGLSMAALKLFSDVQACVHGETSDWSPPQKDLA